MHHSPKIYIFQKSIQQQFYKNTCSTINIMIKKKNFPKRFWWKHTTYVLHKTILTETHTIYVLLKTFPSFWVMGSPQPNFLISFNLMNFQVVWPQFCILYLCISFNLASILLFCYCETKHRLRMLFQFHPAPWHWIEWRVKLKVLLRIEGISFSTVEAEPPLLTIMKRKLTWQHCSPL